MVGVLGLSTAACAGAAAPPADVVSVDRPAARPTTLSLERAEPFEVLVIAEQLAGEPVLVEAMALASLRCITVTVKEPAPLPPRDAATRLFDALRAQGFRVDHGDHDDRGKRGWTVGIDASRPPAACAPGRATAASEAEAHDKRPAANAAGAGNETEMDDAAALAVILASIREISPTEHTIKQQAADLLFEHQNIMMKAGRIVPEQAGGKITGLRMFGIRADGVLGRLGFENGDRLERIQGKSMASPEQALEVYAALRGAKTIEIEVNRRGASKKLTVRVE